MLREYQDEILRLKQQLEATQRGVIIAEDGTEININDLANNRSEIIVEKIIEKEIIVEVDKSSWKIEELEKKSSEEKQMLIKQAQEDMKMLVEKHR